MDDPQPAAQGATSGPPVPSLGGGWQGPGFSGFSSRGPRLLGGRGGRRATVISTISTLVVLAILAAIFLLAPGSGEVRHAFFSPANMWQPFIGNPPVILSASPSRRPRRATGR